MSAISVDMKLDGDLRMFRSGTVQQSHWAIEEFGHDGLHDVDERKPDSFVQHHDDGLRHISADYEHCQLWRW